MNFHKKVAYIALLLHCFILITYAQSYEEYAQTWEGQKRARFQTYHMDEVRDAETTQDRNKAGYVSDRPREWSRSLGDPGPNRLVDPFEWSPPGEEPKAKHVLIMVHGYGPMDGKYLDRHGDFFVKDLSELLGCPWPFWDCIHMTGVEAWYWDGVTGADYDISLYPYLRETPPEYGFDPSEWVILSVTMDIKPTTGLAITENARRLRALIDLLWYHYKSRIKTISIASHSTGGPVVKSVLSDRGGSYTQQHEWLRYVDDHINLAGALGGTPTVLLEPLAFDLRHQLLYGIQDPDDYTENYKYDLGYTVEDNIHKRSQRYLSHINIFSVAGVWSSLPLLELNQPFDGSPWTGTGIRTFFGKSLRHLAPMHVFIGKSDGVVPNLSVIERIQYRSSLPSNPWKHQTNPSTHYTIDWNADWRLPSLGTNGGGRILSGGSPAVENIPAYDRYPGQAVTYVEIQAEHNGMLHNEHLMRAVKKRLGTRTVTPNVETPVITQLSQREGPQSGGTMISIYGSGFRYVSSVWFGNFEAINVSVISGNQINVEVPASNIIGPVTVSVRNTAGESGTTPAEQTAHQYEYKGTLSLPVIVPDGGEFAEPVSITLVSPDQGARIYYTWNGSDPDPANNAAHLYSSPIVAPVNPFTGESVFTLRVRSVKEHHFDSPVASATFSTGATAAAPVIAIRHPNVPNGTVQVSLTTTTPSVSGIPPSIFYTLDGTEPTYTSTFYSGPFTLGIGNHPIKARTIQFQYNASPVSTEDVTVYDPSTAVSNPVVKPFSSQQFAEPITVTMENYTEGAVIRYTIEIDGGLPPDPTESGAGGITYSGPFTMNIPGQHMYIKARAFKQGHAPSSVIQTGELKQNIPITKAGNPEAYARFFLEGLRGSIPEDWSAQDGGGNAIEVSADGGYLRLDHEDDWIMSSSYNVSPTNDISFTVDIKGFNAGTNRRLGIQVSTDNGETWFEEQFVTGTTGQTWVTQGPFDLPDGAQSVRFRFKRVDEFGNAVATGRALGMRDFQLLLRPKTYPERNVFSNPVHVTLHNFTPNPSNPQQNIASTILYTLNGSEPDKTLPIIAPTSIYPAQGFTVNSSRVLKTKAVNSSFLTDSDVVIYDLSFKADTPRLVPDTAVFADSVTVSIVSSTQGAQIRYTTDGSDPHSGSDLYNSPIIFTDSLVNIRARAFRNGYEPSEIISGIYEVKNGTTPSIVYVPESRTVIHGDSLVLFVLYTGFPEPGVQWYKEDTPIEDATSDTLFIYPVSSEDQGSYRVIVENSIGRAESTPVIVTVEPLFIAPVIENQPVGISTAVGGTATLSVIVRARPEAQYQWYINQEPVKDATERSLHFENIGLDDTGTYHVLIWNEIGESRSDDAEITVAQSVRPVITKHPQDTTVVEGDRVVFSPEASGTPLPAYQWLFNNLIIPGALIQNYAIENAQQKDSGEYAAIVSNFAGIDTSFAARLTVEPVTSVADGIASGIPDVFALHQNYPNPFNPSTTIRFDIPKDGIVRLEIYNVLGQRVAVLIDEYRSAGYYTEDFNAGHLASGMYFYRLQAGDFTSVRRLMLVR